MTAGLRPFYHISSPTTSVIVDCRHRQPSITYLGAPLREVNVDGIGQLDRHEAPAALPSEPSISLTPTIGESYLGNPGLVVHRGNTKWQLSPKLLSADCSALSLSLRSQCEQTQVEVTHSIVIDALSQTVRISVSIHNIDDASSLFIDSCLMTIPMASALTDALEMTGRWGHEFQRQRIELPHSTLVRESRAGRTSHNCHPSLTLLSKTASSDFGDAVAVHLGWSGNHTIRAEVLADGRKVLQAGELLQHGEIELRTGAVYQSPECFVCFSRNGTNELTQQWHGFIRHHFSRKAPEASHPRPVQINTWEALYFDLSESALNELIEQSAELGIERFVIDDGWFKRRNSDQTSLGDWDVDNEKFPSGLSPFIESCHRRGMTFGLWIEPEMVSVDSDLYRQHPDWVLGLSGRSSNEARHQLVLDLSQSKVTDYLFSKISKLLSNHRISYLKWDMNRDIHQAENSQGAYAIHGQTQALYALLARLRNAFPQVAIESCASGGGRVDLGILQYVSRFWPSDTNDALDRLTVQSNFLSLLPAEFMGTHVGPSPCHLTGRQHTMAFRAGVAFWGHMGVEADLRSLTDEDRAILGSAIALHKEHRGLLHSGDYTEHRSDLTQMAWSIVSKDRRSALTAVAMLKTPIRPFPDRLTLDGLDPLKNYRLNLVWPKALNEHQAKHRDSLSTLILGGDWLMSVGLSLPIMSPESIFIYCLEEA